MLHIVARYEDHGGAVYDYSATSESHDVVGNCCGCVDLQDPIERRRIVLDIYPYINSRAVHTVHLNSVSVHIGYGDQGRASLVVIGV